MSPPPLRKHLNAYHLDAPPIRESSAIISPRHRALCVVVDKLAQDTSQRLVGKEAEVDAGLCVALAGEDTAVACAEGDHVSWTGEIFGADVG